MENVWAMLGSIGGLLVAVLLLALAWWVVTRARAGNRKVRSARNDPHAAAGRSYGHSKDPERDIPQ